MMGKKKPCSIWTMSVLVGWAKSGEIGSQVYGFDVAKYLPNGMRINRQNEWQASKDMEIGNSLVFLQNK